MLFWRRTTVAQKTVLVYLLAVETIIITNNSSATKQFSSGLIEALSNSEHDNGCSDKV